MIKSHLVPLLRSPTGNSELIMKGLIISEFRIKKLIRKNDYM